MVKSRTSVLLPLIALAFYSLAPAYAIRGNDHNGEEDGPPDFSGFDYGGGGFGGGGKTCKSFKCSKGFDAAPKRPLKLTGMGCSGMGIITADTSESEGPVAECCNKRAACFQTCGMSKASCDKTFETCANAACAVIFDPDEKQKCESTQKLQVMMAGMGGCQEFDQGQAAGCQCMAPEKAVARREKTLRDFYKKHNPKAEESKVPGLMSKSGDNAKKFAALLTQLVGKYPAAIKVKKSEQQEMMERIMREGREKGDSAHEPPVVEEESHVESGRQKKGKGARGNDDPVDITDDLDAVLSEL